MSQQPLKKSKKLVNYNEELGVPVHSTDSRRENYNGAIQSSGESPGKKRAASRNIFGSATKKNPQKLNSQQKERRRSRDDSHLSMFHNIMYEGGFIKLL